MAALGKQENFAVNTNKSQLYIEDSATPLSYNFKTDQWTTISDYAGIGFYSVDSGINIGLARVSTNAVDLQQPDSTDPPLTASIITGESTFSDGTRRIITGIRPLLTGNDAQVSLFSRDTLNPSTRTNYFLQSEDFTDAAWTDANSTITTNDTTAPDGSLADRWNGDGVGSVSITQTTQNLGSTGDDYVVSAYIKYLSQQYIRLSSSTGGTNAYIVFDVQNGTAGLTADPQNRLVTYGIEAASQGFYRVYAVFTDHDDATPSPFFAMSDSTGTTLPTTTNGVYIWGAMCEAASAMGTYIASGASAGTSTLDQTTEATINSRSGVANFRAESRYHRIKLRIPDGFTTILGADVEFYPTGEI